MVARCRGQGVFFFSVHFEQCCHFDAVGAAGGLGSWWVFVSSCDAEYFDVFFFFKASVVGEAVRWRLLCLQCDGV